MGQGTRDGGRGAVGLGSGGEGAQSPSPFQHGPDEGRSTKTTRFGEIDDFVPPAKVQWEPGKLVSHSEMTTWRRCGREWSYRYRERLEPLIAAEALVRGRKVHEALAQWWSRGSAWGPLSPPKLLDLGSDEMGAADRAMLRGYSANWGKPTLDGVQVDVPIRVELDGVTVVGSCDAVGVQPLSGAVVVVEHKTTGSDISPGSSYWRSVVTTAIQPSIYLLAYPGATVLWDALRKPAMRKLEANSKRKEPETDAEYEARCVADMAERPEFYFQRAQIVRLEEEQIETVRDIQLTAEAMEEAPKLPARNPDACHSFGRVCDFYEMCWSGRTVRDSGDTLVRADFNHTEQIAGGTEL